MGFSDMKIERSNVGKIAERIVMNELEFRGYRGTDLNKDGLSANADLLATRRGRVWQVQVKGATNEGYKDWWVQLGHNTQDIINRTARMFNRRNSFYSADLVVLVAVRSPREYRCFVLPVLKAERLAQICMDRGYRTARLDGGKKQPGKIWLWVGPRPKERPRTRDIQKMMMRERKILCAYEDRWNLLR